MPASTRKRNPMEKCARCGVPDYLYPDKTCNVCHWYLKRADLRRQKARKLRDGTSKNGI